MHKPELLLLIYALLLWFLILAKNKTLFSWFSCILRSPHSVSSSPGPRYFLRPNPRPPGCAQDHVTPHGASQEAAFNWAAPGCDTWSVRRNELKGPCYFFSVSLTRVSGCRWEGWPDAPACTLYLDFIPPNISTSEGYIPVLDSYLADLSLLILCCFVVVFCKTKSFSPNILKRESEIYFFRL